MKKLITTTLVVVMIAVLMFCVSYTLTGCSSEAQRVSNNISMEADSFNVQRRLVAVNTRTDKVIFEVIGLFSVQRDGSEIDVIMEVGPNLYKKHWFYINDYVTYSVEDISGAYVDKYHYEINILPEMLQPITFVSNP